MHSGQAFFRATPQSTRKKNAEQQQVRAANAFRRCPQILQPLVVRASHGSHPTRDRFSIVFRSGIFRGDARLLAREEREAADRGRAQQRRVAQYRHTAPAAKNRSRAARALTARARSDVSASRSSCEVGSRECLPRSTRRTRSSRPRPRSAALEAALMPYVATVCAAAPSDAVDQVLGGWTADEQGECLRVPYGCMPTGART